MKLSELKQLLGAMIDNQCDVTAFAWGQHGIGKSAAVAQVARDKGMKFFDLRLSQKEAVDLAGMLYITEKNGVSVTSTNPPDWFYSALMEGNCVLFLDELNQARREVLNAAFELVLDRKLNNQRLPDSVFIVCAGNPEDERYDVTPMSEALKDRLMHIHVKPDTGDFLQYMRTTGFPQEMISFISCNPEAAFHRDERDDKFPVEIKHSMRSWERAKKIVSLPGLSENIKHECLSGIIGSDLATGYIKSIHDANKPLTGQEMLDSTISKPALEAWLRGDSPRNDLVSVSLDNLVAYIKADMKRAENNADHLVQLTLALPNDLTFILVNNLYQNPVLAKALVENKEVDAKLEAMQKASNEFKKKDEQQAALKVKKG